MVDPDAKELYLVRKGEEGHAEVIHFMIEARNHMVIRGVADNGERSTMVASLPNLHFNTQEEAIAYLRSEGFTDISTR